MSSHGYEKFKKKPKNHMKPQKTYDNQTNLNKKSNNNDNKNK